MYYCPECNKPTKKNIKTICRACYQKKRYTGLNPATCHPDRKNHAGGFCRSCYRAGSRAAKATCHPDRLHIAKGLCGECYRALPENKARLVNNRRLKKYKLSQDEYNQLLTKQGHKCAICGAKPDSVDHDHANGKVRGLLCNRCNTGLGQFKDSIELLINAIKYLTGD